MQALFEIGNCFWLHKNQDTNFARSTEDIMILFKGATKSYWKIIFVSATKIGENIINILNCYFLS